MVKYFASTIIFFAVLFFPFDVRADESLPDQTGTLNIDIVNLKNQKGSVCVSLFGGPEGFPASAKNALLTGCFKIKEKPMHISYDRLHFGHYAVALFHDENSDGKLNTGLFGIPTEGFGFSNNPHVGMHAPNFKDCAFLISSLQTDISIQIKNF